MSRGGKERGCCNADVEDVVGPSRLVSVPYRTRFCSTWLPRGTNRARTRGQLVDTDRVIEEI